MIRLLISKNSETFFEFIQLIVIAIVICFYGLSLGMYFGILIGVWRIGDILKRKRIYIHIDKPDDIT